MVRVEIDARVGGAFSFVDRRAGEEIEHVGRYVEIDRPGRLAFEFGVPKYSDLMTRVAVDIAAVADGCEIVLTHTGVPRDQAARAEAGWRATLDRLAHAIEN